MLCFLIDGSLRWGINGWMTKYRAFFVRGFLFFSLLPNLVEFFVFFKRYSGFYQLDFISILFQFYFFSTGIPSHGISFQQNNYEKIIFFYSECSIFMKESHSFISFLLIFSHWIFTSNYSSLLSHEIGSQVHPCPCLLCFFGFCCP